MQENITVNEPSHEGIRPKFNGRVIKAGWERDRISLGVVQNDGLTRPIFNGRIIKAGWKRENFIKRKKHNGK